MEIDQMRVVREKRERATRDEPFLFLEFLAQLSPDAETLCILPPSSQYKPLSRLNISKIHLPLKSSPNVDIGQNFCRSSDDTGNDADLMLNFVNQRFDRCRFIGQRQVDGRLLHTGQHGRRVLVEDARPVNHIPVKTILIEQSYLKFV